MLSRTARLAAASTLFEENPGGLADPGGLAEAVAGRSGGGAAAGSWLTETSSTGVFGGGAGAQDATTATLENVRSNPTNPKAEGMRTAPG
jgi:hypothetical protein